MAAVGTAAGLVEPPRPDRVGLGMTYQSGPQNTGVVSLGLTADVADGTGCPLGPEDEYFLLASVAWRNSQLFAVATAPNQRLGWLLTPPGV
jgi:hypothetical protein